MERNVDEVKKIKKRKKKKKGDRCIRIAKRKYDVWPSAYASGAVVKCRKGKIWKGLSEQELNEVIDEELEKALEEGLTDFLKKNAGRGKAKYGIVKVTEKETAQLADKGVRERKWSFIY